MSELAKLFISGGFSVLVGLLTGTGALIGVRSAARGNATATDQRENAARREEWWRRFAWASGLMLEEIDTKRVAGLRVLTTLAKSDLAEEEELELLDAIQWQVLERLVGDPIGEDGDQS